MQKRAALPTATDLSLAPVSITLELKQRNSVAARLRPMWPEIVRAIEDENITHAEIIRSLEKAGLSVPLKTFQSELYRYRKSLKAASE